MERGDYGRARQPKRARPTDRDLQELIAQISQIDTDAKVTVIRPVSGLAKVLGSLAAVVGLSAGIMRFRSNR